jgi:lipopolysaccharide export system protein LptC
MRNWAAGLAFPLTVFVALALLTTWLRYVTGVPAPSFDGKFRHDPDYLIEDFRAVQVSSAGNAEYILSAARLLHYPDTDESVVESPRLIHRRPDGSVVDVQARRGLLDHDAEILSLRDGVQLTKGAGTAAEMRFTTDTLTVIPRAGLATGDGPVDAESPWSRLSGVGFSADFDSRRFVLHGAVRGHFVPAPPR